ncbi:hypothetical protein Vadar_018810 [Vaccinium darrowii]|uniref:Uncharacterized protein n=1 Tax=Vaccinium darrowii TaxID=229202 RepID=A0ACB7XIU0_9ERIC|nr:hypothetical protein Vadar_018810 [Vaccinium darrowii]
MTFKQWWTTYTSLAQSDCSSQEDVGLMAFICWALWKARNKDYFDNLPRDFFAVLEQGVSGWNEFRTVNDKRGGVIPPSTPPPTPIWKPPDGNCVKINVDGALSVNNYMGGLGLVARDSAGNLLGARMESLRGTFSVRTIEALGVRRALETALEWNYTHVIVEGDALQDRSAFDAKARQERKVEEVVLKFRKINLIDYCH